MSGMSLEGFASTVMQQLSLVELEPL